MSQRIGQFVNWNPRKEPEKYKKKNLHLHASMGGKKGGRTISFIIDQNPVRLTEKQLYRLVETIQRRLCYDDEYTATGTENTVEIVLPTGERILKPYIEYSHKEYHQEE